jgi:hypothetical protein
VSPTKVLSEAGVRRIKHVFRYDLSPLFARLDDAVKQVPVLDGAPRRVRFIDAPRCYRLPIKIRVTCDGQSFEEAATLVLHKRGLDRLERDTDDRGASDGRVAAVPELVPLKETGIEPDHAGVV